MTHQIMYALLQSKSNRNGTGLLKFIFMSTSGSSFPTCKISL